MTVSDFYILIVLLFSILAFFFLFFSSFYLVRCLQEDKIAFTNKTIMRLYLRLGAFLSQFISTISLAFFFKSLLSYILGTSFSYSTIYKISGTFISNDVTKAIQQRDLVGGLTVFSVMLILWIIHHYSLEVLESKRDKNDSFLSKLYLFSNLGLYGLLTIFVLPISLFQIISYLVADNNLINAPTPGVYISLSLAVLPVWTLYLLQALKKFKGQKKK